MRHIPNDASDSGCGARDGQVAGEGGFESCSNTYPVSIPDSWSTLVLTEQIELSQLQLACVQSTNSL